MNLVEGILHVNLTIAPGSEALAQAHRFYVEILGLSELTRPTATDNGAPGFWLGCGNGQEVHLSAESRAIDLNGASARHAAFQATSVANLRQVLHKAGVSLGEFQPEPDNPKRLFIRDPWGNRLEFVELTKDE